jgi:hypothetical protein
MKHLLNDLSGEEKNRILEQYNNSLIVETQKFNKLLKSSLGNVKPLMEMDGDDEFEMTNDDESSEYPTYEQFKDEIDDFFSNYGDYINPERLKQEVDMLLGFMNDDFEYIGEGNEERVDDDVSYEKKGSPLVTITVDGGDLIKAYLDNDYRYDYGVNSVELGGRFFFDENVYNDFINKN